MKRAIRWAVLLVVLVFLACADQAGSEIEASPEPTAVLTAAPTAAPTKAPTPEPTPEPTPTPTPEPTPTHTPEPTPFGIVWLPDTQNLTATKDEQILVQLDMLGEEIAERIGERLLGQDVPAGAGDGELLRAFGKRRKFASDVLRHLAKEQINFFLEIPRHGPVERP